jgi:peptidoglycan/xylan/chitin deacetylase (PgdA/CDA1 family)
LSGGALVISLDLELYWGVRDGRTLDGYRENLEGVRRAVPLMLSLFAEYGVHATWATVGLLFLRDANDARVHAPAALPSYADKSLCPYEYLRAGGGGSDAQLHFAPDVIEEILRASGQELATHTFSHFYCLEEPARLDTFRADLDVAQSIARARFGAPLTSLVFPRNQYSAAHVKVAGEAGITAYRGNPEGWMYSPRPKRGESALRRGARLADAFLPVSGDLSFSPSAEGALAGPPYNVPASRFLRPWSKELAWAEPFRVGRVVRELALAARRGRIYHLWWHPHNFGRNTAENMGALANVLRAFSHLRETYGMASLTMGEVGIGMGRSEAAHRRPMAACSSGLPRGRPGEGGVPRGAPR